MKSKTTEVVKAGVFLAFGLLIPYVFHLTSVAGSIFLPMHIPVLLCGFIMGARYGLIIGFITPLLNAVLTGMPPIYPTAIAMAFELANYGLIAGWLYKNKNMNVFISLIIAMLLGRVVSGVANYILLGFAGKKYVLQMFLMSAFVKSIWGIIIQLVLIPLVIKSLEIDKAKGMARVNE
jgi:riboflavin transporter FmnP